MKDFCYSLSIQKKSKKKYTKSKMELELKLICGNHLAVQDIYTSDPYIKFEAGGKKYKSKKMYKNGPFSTN